MKVHLNLTLFPSRPITSAARLNSSMEVKIGSYHGVVGGWKKRAVMERDGWSEEEE